MHLVKGVLRVDSARRGLSLPHYKTSGTRLLQGRRCCCFKMQFLCTFIKAWKDKKDVLGGEVGKLCSSVFFFKTTINSCLSCFQFYCDEITSDSSGIGPSESAKTCLEQFLLFEKKSRENGRSENFSCGSGPLIPHLYFICSKKLKNVPYGLKCNYILQIFIEIK